MSIRCILGHSWNGCRCEKCGTRRDDGHNWDQDCSKCSICGKERKVSHIWNGCRCDVCGKTRNKKHKFDTITGKCSLCGKTGSFREITTSPRNNEKFVEGGSFEMGSSYSDEKPVRRVFVKSFYMCATLVTQLEWKEIMSQTKFLNLDCLTLVGFVSPTMRNWRELSSSLHESFINDNHPIVYVSWDEAVEYCNMRSKLEGLTPCYYTGAEIRCNFSANGYRLPTEAEWEYAARGGKLSKSSKYSGSDTLDEVAWYHGNSEDRIHPIGLLLPNELGIYDMSGNVWEHCWDFYDSQYYGDGADIDPLGPGAYIPKSDSLRVEHVIRGGAFNSDHVRCRVSCRSSTHEINHYDWLGFRLVRTFNKSSVINEGEISSFI